MSLPEKEEEFIENDDPRSAPSTYECVRCDAEFTRTDIEVEDEGQSTEYCDDCLELIDQTEKMGEKSGVEDDEEVEEEEES